MPGNSTEKKVHLESSCPGGQHYVKTHTVTYRPSAAHPNGHTALRLGHYWNDIFKPEEPLDPKLIKALMASESSFRQDPPPGHVRKKDAKKLKNPAKGLLQITRQTLKILNDPDGELKNHLFNIDSKELLTPSVNICMSVRWIFHKKVMATRRLKKEATWMEAIAEYKGYHKNTNADEVLKTSGMNNILYHYSVLQDKK